MTNEVIVAVGCHPTRLPEFTMCQFQQIYTVSENDKHKSWSSWIILHIRWKDDKSLIDWSFLLWSMLCLVLEVSVPVSINSFQMCHLWPHAINTTFKLACDRKLSQLAEVTEKLWWYCIELHDEHLISSALSALKQFGSHYTEVHIILVKVLFAPKHFLHSPSYLKTHKNEHAVIQSHAISYLVWLSSTEHKRYSWKKKIISCISITLQIA